MAVIELRDYVKQKKMKEEFIRESHLFQEALGMKLTVMSDLEKTFEEMSPNEQERILDFIKTQRLIYDLVNGRTSDHPGDEVWLVKINDGTPFEQWIVGKAGDPGAVRFVRDK